MNKPTRVINKIPDDDTEVRVYPGQPVAMLIVTGISLVPSRGNMYHEVLQGPMIEFSEGVPRWLAGFMAGRRRHAGFGIVTTGARLHKEYEGWCKWQGEECEERENLKAALRAEMQ